MQQESSFFYLSVEPDLRCKMVYFRILDHVPYHITFQLALALCLDSEGFLNPHRHIWAPFLFFTSPEELTGTVIQNFGDILNIFHEHSSLWGIELPWVGKAVTLL